MHILLQKRGSDTGPLPRFVFGAGNEIRTRDPDLGKVVLYQLSYSRIKVAYFKQFEPCVNVILR